MAQYLFFLDDKESSAGTLTQAKTLLDKVQNIKVSDKLYLILSEKDKEKALESFTDLYQSSKGDFRFLFAETNPSTISGVVSAAAAETINDYKKKVS